MSRPRTKRAFSLIELVMVVVIMGIVAAVAVSRVGDMATRAKIASTREAVRVIQATVDEEQAATGQWPTVLTSVMFAGSRWPRNAFLPGQLVPIEIANGAAQHPGNMAASGVSDGAFWYNNTAGIVRARVSPRGSNAETLALYNWVNGTNVKVLTTVADQTTGPAEGGAGLAAVEFGAE